MTVGHIEQTAIVKSAAGSDFWNRTSPSGSHASGEIGRRICMSGSNIRVRIGETPKQKPERGRRCNPEQEALRHPEQAVVREQNDTLVRLAALFEGFEDVDLALLPVATAKEGPATFRLERPPHHERETDAHQRQQQMHRRFINIDLFH